MAAWLMARSLDTLLAQLNAAYPARSRISDGGIGDAAHATRDSDHNPWFVLGGQALVTARDYTHDPAAGLDCTQLAVTLRASKDPRIKYVIWNRAIMSGASGPSPWVWRAYSGSNPHTKHLHLSVVADARCQSTAPWSIPAAAAPAPREDEDDMSWFEPSVPDYYRSPGEKTQRRDLPSPREALAFATLHAANARDRATEATTMATHARDEAFTARQELAALRGEVAALRELLTQSAQGQADPRAFAAAVAADLAARLTG